MNNILNIKKNSLLFLRLNGSLPNVKPVGEFDKVFYILNHSCYLASDNHVKQKHKKQFRKKHNTNS